MTDIFRVTGEFARWQELLDLILAAFAYMDAVIDPPSSARQLTAATLAERSQREIALLAVHGNELVGCVFCKPEPSFLYLSKLAVAPRHQRTGLGRRLVAATEEVARQDGLPALRLETRIELTGNHRAFERPGFVKTAEHSHPGYTRITSIEMQKRLASSVSPRQHAIGRPVTIEVGADVDNHLVPHVDAAFDRR